MAPEVSMLGSHNSSSYSKAVDMWSLGCMAHWLSTGRTPFEGGTTLYDYCNHRKPFPLEALQERGLSAVGITFISTLMAIEPADRMIASQALEYSWLQSEPLDGSLLGTGLQPKLPSNITWRQAYNDLMMGQIDGSKSPSTVGTQTAHAVQVTAPVPDNKDVLSGEVSEPKDTADSRPDISLSAPERPEGAVYELVRFLQVPDVHPPTPLLSPVREVRTPSPSAARPKRNREAELGRSGGLRLRIPSYAELVRAKQEKQGINGALGQKPNSSPLQVAESAKLIQSPPDTRMKDQSVASSWDQSQIDQHVPGSWDQFKANERLFGITNSFDDRTYEQIYTTYLDKTSATYKSREAEAERIAHEIEFGVQHNIAEAAEQSVNRSFGPTSTGNESLAESRPSVQDHNDSDAFIDSLPKSKPKGQKKKPRKTKILDIA